jgi:hypothetical protein
VRSFSSDNWLVAITSGGDVAIKLRSFANSNLPRQDKIVLVLQRSDREIEFVRARRDRIVTPARRGSEQFTHSMLELGVSDELARQVVRAVREERDRDVPMTGTTIKRRTIIMGFPVTVSGNIIQVQWRGPQTFITPALDKAVKIIARATGARAEPAQSNVIDNNSIKGKAEAEQRILQLAEQGDRVAAITLTRKTYNMSLADAVKFVDELTTSQRA